MSSLQRVSAKYVAKEFIPHNRTAAQLMDSQAYLDAKSNAIQSLFSWYAVDVVITSLEVIPQTSPVGSLYRGRRSRKLFEVASSGRISREEQSKSDEEFEALAIASSKGLGPDPVTGRARRQLTEATNFYTVTT
jgi:hypothetical protein